jgi:superfamily II DNA or RNA helicase
MRKKNPKLKYWDGKVRLFKHKSKLLPQGLLDLALEWLTDKNYTYQIIRDEQTEYKFDEQLYTKLVTEAGLSFAEDQKRAIKHCIEHRTCLLVSPTSSGKSFIIYNIISHVKKPSLIIVPTIQLTDQMEKDFRQYGFKGSIYKLCYGEQRDIDVGDEDCVVGTWQTLCKLPESFFEQFHVCIGDEAHEYEAKNVSSVVQSCINAYYKIGTTGTIKGAKMHQWILQGLFGPIYQAITTKQLIENKRVSDLKIIIMVLKYSDDIKASFWLNRITYNDELSFLFDLHQRNLFIRGLVKTLQNNCLVMFKYKEAHGVPLYEKILADNPTKQVFYVDGDTQRADREKLREAFEHSSNCIGVTSLGTFSRGINIKNLHHLVFATLLKAEITTLQSIGRALRLHESKKQAVLWDIVDDMTQKGKHNAAMEHFQQRLATYTAAGFEYEIREYNIF